MNAIDIDARGMRCPWPALRLARAMRSAAPNQRIQLRTNDPKASSEIKILAGSQQWLIKIEEKEGESQFTVFK